MNRNLIELISWEAEIDGISDEIGIDIQTITLSFSSINEGETVEKRHHVIASSEHFIATDKFVIRRESWAKSGLHNDSYLNYHEVLEMLEKTII